MRLMVCVFMLLATSVHAEGPAHFTSSVLPETVRPGETATVWLDVTLQEGWHIYSATTPEGGPYPTEFAISGDGFFWNGTVIQPPPILEHDPNFDMIVEYYGNSVRFGLPIRRLQSPASANEILSGEVTYMLCNATSCLPPTTFPFSIAIGLEEGEPRSQYVAAMGENPKGREDEPMDGTGSVADVDRAVSRGLGAFLSLSFSMGLLALLTPCVFPMIPITVSFFTKQASQTRGETIAKSLAYCGGIIFTFTGLGLVLAVTLGASGAAQFASNPWINLLIAGIFVAFALALFGLFEIQLPYGLLNRLHQVKGGAYGGILLMGFTFSLTSFTCTAPFVGTLLVLTSQGTWIWPVLGMLVFSTAFALPFFFLSLFPQALAALPQSGGWLNSVKVVMGFLELAAAMKFLSNVDLVWQWGFLSREVFIAVWIVLFAVCGFYLLGKIRLPHDSILDTIGPLRLLASVAVLSFSTYLTTGLIGAPLGELDAFFPPYGSHGEIARIRSGEPALAWHVDYETALAEAKATKKPIFIDFTGYACTNCRWMEANVFPKPEVRVLLEKFIRVQLYTDGREAVHTSNREFQETRFGTVALPLYAVLDANGKTLSQFPGMTRDVEVFVRFLEKGLGPHAKVD
ncbi:MAG: thioredoxin family protein [bacterium]|nr:thioredoxin family protein [bacterium]